MRIWKYVLKATDEQTIDMPAGARMLSAQAQHGEMVLWALVNETARLKTHTVQIIGTGNPIPTNLGEYIDTVQLHGGALAFHVFVLAD
jgi:hypothetical protein